MMWHLGLGYASKIAWLVGCSFKCGCLAGGKVVKDLLAAE